jgi:hypothetical protein
MAIDKYYKINRETENIWSKDLFLFVNHKAAVFCWAGLKEKTGLCDVVTFDSHGDFKGGFIINRTLSEIGDLPDENDYLFSKYTCPPSKDFLHFKTSKEFTEWDLLDEEKNKEIVEKQNKFFNMINDNLIDIAFMKNVVNNVYCYYFDLKGNNNSGKCDDVDGKDHYFIMKKVDNFTEPKKNFILDIDLDFFTVNFSPRYLLSLSKIRKYLRLMKKLGQKENCKGITMALEPYCCGSKENCLKICKKVSEIFKKDISSISEGLLKDI